MLNDKKKRTDEEKRWSFQKMKTIIFVVVSLIWRKKIVRNNTKKLTKEQLLEYPFDYIDTSKQSAG